MFLSGAMMLDWLGERFNDSSMKPAGSLLHKAVDSAFAAGTLVTTELGGNAGVDAVTNAVTEALLHD